MAPGQILKSKGSGRLVCYVLALGLCGCVGRPAIVDPHPQIPEFRLTSEQVVAAVPSDPRLHADVLALDDAVRAQLLAQLGAGDKRWRLQQLVDMMQSPQQLGLRYTATATRTAMETLHSGEGNCLSLSALFVAMAREAGLDARFQDVELLPAWRQDGDVFVVERHINAVVAIDGHPLIVDFLVQPAGSVARSHLISDRAMTAQYLNNLGVEHLSAGRTELAYRFFRRSIELSPETAYLWLNLGVALARNGQRDEAEQLYLHAVRLDPNDVVALSNLAGLYEVSGRGELARSAMQKVERLRQANPYYRYWLAERYFSSGDFTGAIAQLHAALALKPEEGAFHFALTRAYIETGAMSDAERSLAEALKYTSDADTRASYEARYRESVAARTIPPQSP